MVVCIIFFIIFIIVVGFLCSLSFTPSKRLPLISAATRDCTTALAQCKDGTCSHSSNRAGTCSHHGGVSIWKN